MTEICHSCLRGIPAGSHFCPFCGTPIGSEEIVESRSRAEAMSIWIERICHWAGGIYAIVLIGGGLIGAAKTGEGKWAMIGCLAGTFAGISLLGLGELIRLLRHLLSKRK